MSHYFVMLQGFTQFEQKQQFFLQVLGEMIIYLSMQPAVSNDRAFTNIY